MAKVIRIIEVCLPLFLLSALTFLILVIYLDITSDTGGNKPMVLDRGKLVG